MDEAELDQISHGSRPALEALGVEVVFNLSHHIPGNRRPNPLQGFTLWIGGVIFGVTVEVGDGHLGTLPACSGSVSLHLSAPCSLPVLYRRGQEPTRRLVWHSVQLHVCNSAHLHAFTFARFVHSHSSQLNATKNFDITELSS
jgi:hypothetical protein